MIKGYEGKLTFFGIFENFDSHQIHNMLFLMLDRYFKFLRVMENFVGHGNAIHFITKYDVKEFMSSFL
jgi:hypothetical protein